MKKIVKNVPVMKQELEEKEIYVTEDGRESEEDARKHEALKDLKVIRYKEVL